MYVAICKCFLKVQRNQGVLHAVSGVDFPEAQQQQLEAILVAVGEKEAAPPPPPPKSIQEILEEQVREDWRKLPSDKLKIKLQRDPQYKKVFDRLMAANQLDSIATSYTNGSGEFGQ